MRHRNPQHQRSLPNYSPRTLTSPLFRVLESRRCAPCPSACPPAVDMLSAILLAYRLSVCISEAEASRRAWRQWKEACDRMRVMTKVGRMGRGQVYEWTGVKCVHGMEFYGRNGEEEEVGATQPGSVITHQIYQSADLAVGRFSVAVLVVYPAKHPGQVLGQIKWEQGRRSHTNQGVQA